MSWPNERTYYRLKHSLLRLEGTNCQQCGTKHFPPVTVCPDCASHSQASLNVSVNPQKVEIQAGLESQTPLVIATMYLLEKGINLLEAATAALNLAKAHIQSLSSNSPPAPPAL